jgi:hypothetical protein
MESELIFKGTPYQFVTVATTLTYRRGDTDEPVEFLPTREIGPEAGFAEVIFFGPGMRQRGIGGRIIAQTVPEGTLLTVRVDDADRPLLAETWELLRVELDRQGWISIPAPQGSEQAEQERIILQLGKPGRRTDPLYDEAYQKIVNGLSEAEAYEWFCKKVPIKVPDKGTRDSFKAAMKRRQNGVKKRRNKM